MPVNWTKKVAPYRYRIEDKNEYTYEIHVLRLQPPLIVRVIQVDDPDRQDHYSMELRMADLGAKDWDTDDPTTTEEDPILEDLFVGTAEDAKKAAIEMTGKFMLECCELMSKP